MAATTGFERILLLWARSAVIIEVERSALGSSARISGPWRRLKKRDAVFDAKARLSANWIAPSTIIEKSPPRKSPRVIPAMTVFDATTPPRGIGGSVGPQQFMLRFATMSSATATGLPAACTDATPKKLFEALNAMMSGRR